MLSRTISASSDSLAASIPETTSQRQHGLHDHHDHGSRLPGQMPSSGSASAPPPGGRGSGPQRSSDNASEAGSTRGRLNSDSSPRTPSPVDRIDEHENASNASRASKNPTLGFKAVHKSQNAKAGSVTIDEFPNGSRRQSPQTKSLLTTDRGPDSHLLPLATAKLVRDLPGLSSFPCSGHHAALVESCVFAILPWLFAA